jgi:hypothetical protein
MNDSPEIEQANLYQFPGPEDPPPDYSREEAAYAREKDRLVREHLGKFAVIYRDEIAGVYGTLGEALSAGYTRFGDVPLQFREIRVEEPIEFVSSVDTNHPSVRRID